MRIRSLHLERFGHFAGAKLAFPESGLTVVHGNNEAGKTTLLEAIRWLLFGGKDTRYAFGFDSQLLAASAQVEIKGTPIDIRRTRGKNGGLKGTVPAGDEVDEGWIHQRLSQPNRAIFENVFGFSLEGLAEGGKALAQADVQAALFGGGLGGTIQPARILASLEEEKEKLFKEKGHAQPIAQALKRIEELGKQVTQSTTRADEWTRRESDLAAKEAVADERAKSLASKSAALERLRAIERAIPAARARAAALAELEGLHAPDALPVDAGARHATLLKERDKLDAALAEERMRASDAHALLEGLEVDEATLAREADIEALAERLPQRERAGVEHPKRARELAELVRQVEERLSNLRPEWSLEDLRAARFDAVALSDLYDAIAAREELGAHAASHQKQLVEAKNELREAQSQLAELPPPVDVAPLRAWHEGWSGFLAERKELQKLLPKLGTLDRKLAASRKKLGDTSDPEAVTGPRVESIVESEAERTRLFEARAQLAQSLASRESDLAKITRELAEIDASAKVPNEGDLAGLRSKRDAVFDTILRAAGEARGELPSLAVTHERARIAADDAADRMRIHANAVQLRAVRDALRTQYSTELAALRVQVEGNAAAIEAHESAWRASWKGIEPGPPAAMRAWLLERDSWLAEARELAELQARRDALEAAIASFVARAPEGADVDAAHAAVKASIEREEARALTANALAQRLARDRSRVSLLEIDGATIESEISAFSQRWSAAVAPFGLPSSTSASAARSVVQGLVELRSTFLAKEQHLRADLEAFARDIEDFDARSPGESDPVAAAKLAVKKLGAAREAARERKQAERDIGDSERRIDAHAVARTQVDRELEALHALARVEEGAFAAVARDRARIEELRNKLAELDRLLDRELLAEVATADLATVRGDIERITRELEVLEPEAKAAHQEVGSARELLRAVDGRSKAAELRNDLEAERAALRAQVERWSVLALAERLLRDAISRFERENQPELLERASALFAEMTLGRFVRVRRHLDRNLWVERVSGAEISPEQLSTGTREQLFLAIRLAYVDQYRKGAEALPIVLDDVLVNFDGARARATLEALARFGEHVQVLLFTCHDHVVDFARAANAVLLQVPAPVAQ
ncbi:MAG: AAA family ATPase [Polyangiales bacterium]